MKTAGEGQNLSLRERKKALTRASIIKAANSLFEKHGFDNVTVAQIADEANIAVKTLFVYFQSKDDLVFTDTNFIDTLVQEIKSRPTHMQPIVAASKALSKMMEKDNTQDGIQDFARGYNTDTLKNSLLRMWSDYEDKIANAISGEDEAPSADDRYKAIEIIGLVRTLVSEEMLNYKSGNVQKQAKKWLHQFQ